MTHNDQILYIFLILIVLCMLLLYKSKTKEAFNTNQIIIHNLTDVGFFSEFFFLCASYIYANKNNILLYINSKSWIYKYKDGWHDYFTSLVEYNDSIKSDNIIHNGHNNHFKNNKTEHTLREYIQAIQEIFKPKEYIQQKAREYINNLGPSYYSIYIRKGDKITTGESQLITIKNIVNMTDIEQNCKVLFVQTDDYSVIEELQELLPNCSIHTMTPTHKKGSTMDYIEKTKGDNKKRDTDELLVSCIVSANATKCWADHRSNVGRFLKLYTFDKKNVFYYPPSIDKDNETYDTIIGPMWG